MPSIFAINQGTTSTKAYVGIDGGAPTFVVSPPTTEIEYRRVAPSGALKDIDRNRFAEALRRASGWTGAGWTVTS